MTYVEHRQLGRDGPAVPVIGFGAWPIGGGMGSIDQASAVRTLHHAFEHGVTLIDTAEAYRGSEEIVGRAVAEWPPGRREKLFIATKVRGDDLSAAHIATAVEQSLRALRIERIDLLQAHSWDPQHPIEESMRTFERLVGDGKVRYIGVSNFSAEQMDAAWQVHAFQALQPRYNVFDREVETSILPYCLKRGIGVLAHSPLAKGLLTGKYSAEHVFAADDERSQMSRFQGHDFRTALQRSAALERWARERGHTVLELAIAWVLAHPAVTTCLCGAKSPDQVDDHVRASTWRLTEEDRAEVVRLVSP
ncbi:MAG: aldo/keto reductase [Chloroflexi bacterium]|nr:aldo/keto reductase [Chloroflexota bacterium]